MLSLRNIAWYRARLNKSKVLKFAKKEGYSEVDLPTLSEEKADTVQYFKDNIGYQQFIFYLDEQGLSLADHCSLTRF